MSAIQRRMAGGMMWDGDCVYAVIDSPDMPKRLWPWCFRNVHAFVADGAGHVYLRVGDDEHMVFYGSKCVMRVVNPLLRFRAFAGESAVFMRLTEDNVCLSPDECPGLTKDDIVCCASCHLGQACTGAIGDRIASYLVAVALNAKDAVAIGGTPVELQHEDFPATGVRTLAIPNHLFAKNNCTDDIRGVARASVLPESDIARTDLFWMVLRSRVAVCFYNGVPYEMPVMMGVARTDEHQAAAHILGLTVDSNGIVNVYVFLCTVTSTEITLSFYIDQMTFDTTTRKIRTFRDKPYTHVAEIGVASVQPGLDVQASLNGCLRGIQFSSQGGMAAALICFQNRQMLYTFFSAEAADNPQALAYCYHMEEVHWGNGARVGNVFSSNEHGFCVSFVSSDGSVGYAIVDRANKAMRVEAIPPQKGITDVHAFAVCRAVAQYAETHDYFFSHDLVDALLKINYQLSVEVQQAISTYNNKGEQKNSQDQEKKIAMLQQLADRYRDGLKIAKADKSKEYDKGVVAGMAAGDEAAAKHKAQLQTIERARDDLQARCDKLQCELANLKSSPVPDETAELRAQLASIKRESDATITSLRQLLAEQRQEAMELRQRLQTQQTENDQAQRVLGAAIEIRCADMERTHAQELQSWRAKMDEATAMIQTLRAELQEQTVNELAQERQSWRAKMDEATTLLTQQTATVQTLRAELQKQRADNDKQTQDEVARERQSWRAKMDEIATQLKQQTATVQALRAQHAKNDKQEPNTMGVETKCAAHAQEHQSWREKMDEQVALVKTLRAEVCKSLQEIIRLRQGLDQQAGINSSNVSTIRQMQQILVAREAEIAVLRKKLVAKAIAGDGGDVSKELAQSLQAITAELDIVKRDNESLRNDNISLRQETSALRGKVAQVPHLQASIQELQSLVADREAYIYYSQQQQQQQQLGLPLPTPQASVASA